MLGMWTAWSLPEGLPQGSDQTRGNGYRNYHCCWSSCSFHLSGSGKRTVAEFAGQNSAINYTNAPSVMFNSRSTHNTGDSLVVDGRLAGRSCPLTVDSGSIISLVRPGLIKQEVEPLQDGWLRTVTGERAPIHGWSDVQLGVGTLELPHRMLVADIKDDCILGFDFLKKHSCVVDFSEDVLTIHNQQVPLQRPKQTTPLTCCRVTLEKSVDIPPMSEVVTSGRVLDRPSNMVWGVVEPATTPLSKFLDGLLMGRTLVNLQAKEVPIHLLNLTNKQKRIKQGTDVAICNTAECAY